VSKTILLLQFVSLTVCAQTFNLEMLAGTDPEFKKNSWHLGMDVGYPIFDMANIHGGFRLTSHVVEPKWNLSDEEKRNLTTSIYNFYFYAGSRVFLPVFKFNKGQENVTTVGIMPECRLFFTPWNPRKFKYKTDDGYITATGKFQPHFCYGIGGGIYIERTEYGPAIVLKCEYTTMDAFKTLRTLDYSGRDMDFSGAVVITLGLSLFKWGFLQS